MFDFLSQRYFQTVNFSCRISWNTALISGVGVKHIVRYVWMKGSQFSKRPLFIRNAAFLFCRKLGDVHNFISYPFVNEKALSLTIFSPRLTALLMAGWEIRRVCDKCVWGNPSSRTAQKHTILRAAAALLALPAVKMSAGFMPVSSAARSTIFEKSKPGVQRGYGGFKVSSA